MMCRLQDCRARAFAEAGADLRQQPIFHSDNTPADLAGLYPAHAQPPHFPLFPLSKPSRRTRTESQRNIQSP
jgi:hypothetical protein